MQDQPPAITQPAQEHPKSTLRKIGLPIMLGGNAADLITTLKAIHSGGGTEANPILGQSTGRIAATKLAGTAGTAWLFDKLAEHHPKLATGLAIASGGLGIGLAAHNAKNIKK